VKGEQGRCIDCRGPLELGLQAAFFTCLLGTIAPDKCLKILIDIVLSTRPPRGRGESNFIEAAKPPGGAPPKHPSVTIGLKIGQNGLGETCV
jgi:hypothetical protein